MSAQKTLNGNKRSKIELDEKLKKAVMEWRQKGYEGASDVTKRLLSYWFFEDHCDSSGRLFNFWQANSSCGILGIFRYANVVTNMNGILNNRKNNSHRRELFSQDILSIP